MPRELNRRKLLGSFLVAAPYWVFGERLLLTPAEAVALEFTPEVLSRNQLNMIEMAAEQLVPGSVEAGIAAYLDAQLRASNDSLLIGKYLGVDISGQVAFYESLARNLQKVLEPEQSISEVISTLWTDSHADWEGPPASYMLFVLRADALDVTYGTPEGFERLGIPYMAHIMPEQPW